MAGLYRTVPGGITAAQTRRNYANSNSWSKLNTVYNPITGEWTRFDNRNELEALASEFERQRIFQLKDQGLMTGRIRHEEMTLDKETGLNKVIAEYESLTFSLSPAESAVFNELDNEEKSRFARAVAEGMIKDASEIPDASTHGLIFDADMHEQTENVHFHGYMHKHPIDVSGAVPKVKAAKTIKSNSIGNDIVHNIRRSLNEAGFNFVNVEDYRVEVVNPDGPIRPPVDNVPLQVEDITEEVLALVDEEQLLSVEEQLAQKELLEAQAAMEAARLRLAEKKKARQLVTDAKEINIKNVQLEADMAELKEKFDAEQVINADLTTRVEDLENSNSALAADLENANDNLKNEQEHNSDLSEENAELVKELEAATAELNSVKNENEELHRSLKTSDETIESLNNEVSEISNQLTSRDKEVIELTSQVSDFSEKLDNVTEELREKADELLKVDTAFQEAQAANENTVSELENKLDELNEQVDFLNEQKDIYERAKHDAERELSAKQAELLTAASERDAAQSQVSTLQTMNETLQSSLKSLQETIESVKAQYQETIDNLQSRFDKVMGLVKGKSITDLVNFRWEQPTEATKDEDRKELGKIYPKKKAAPAPVEDKPKAEKQQKPKAKAPKTEEPETNIPGLKDDGDERDIDISAREAETEAKREAARRRNEQIDSNNQNDIDEPTDDNDNDDGGTFKP